MDDVKLISEDVKLISKLDTDGEDSAVVCLGEPAPPSDVDPEALVAQYKRHCPHAVRPFVPVLG